MRILITTLILCFVTSAYAASRVVGGKNAPDGKYPYQVSLRLRRFNRHTCGGSIINKRWILTAAHCLKNSDEVKVVAGTNLLEGGIEKVYNSRVIITHPEYDSHKIINDIALIKVDRDIEFDDKVNSVSLSSEVFAKVNYPANMTGWGLTGIDKRNLPNNLQEITVNVIDQDECFNKWNDDIQITKSHICTLSKIGEGACSDDSGGPLVSDGHQIGIVSFGKHCATGYPDVFTRVSTFYDWIYKTIKNYENLF